jgi:hypothetical protein
MNRNPFLTPGALRNCDVFGEPIEDERFCPAPCVSIEVTEEMRAKDAAERRAREQAPQLSWKRPEPIADQAYTKPVTGTKAIRSPKRTTHPTQKEKPMITSALTKLPPAVPVTQEGPFRLIDRSDLPEFTSRGRIDVLLAELLKAPAEKALEIPCKDPKHATNTLTQLRSKAKAQGHTVKGGVRDKTAYAWREQPLDKAAL